MACRCSVGAGAGGWEGSGFQCVLGGRVRLAVCRGAWLRLAAALIVGVACLQVDEDSRGCHRRTGGHHRKNWRNWGGLEAGLLTGGVS